MEFLESILQHYAKGFHFGKVARLKKTYLDFKNFNLKYNWLKIIF